MITSTNSNEQSNASGRSNCMLSTVDNPYNPFDDYSEWLMYDNEHDHYSGERLARIAKVSDQLSDEEYIQEVERAVDEIILNDFLNIYIKVYASNQPQ